MPQNRLPNLAYLVSGRAVSEQPDLPELLLSALVDGPECSVHSEHWGERSLAYEAEAELGRRGMFARPIRLLVGAGEAEQAASRAVEADLLYLGFHVERLSLPAQPELLRRLGSALEILVAVVAVSGAELGRLAC